MAPPKMSDVIAATRRRLKAIPARRPTRDRSNDVTIVKGLGLLLLAGFVAANLVMLHAFGPVPGERTSARRLMQTGNWQAAADWLGSPMPLYAVATIIAGVAAYLIYLGRRAG